MKAGILLTRKRAYPRPDMGKERTVKATPVNARQVAASVYPAQIDGETDHDYILRLQRTIEKMAHIQRVSDEENIESTGPKLCDPGEQGGDHGLCADLEDKDKTMASMSGKLDEMTAKLEKTDQMIEVIKLGGSESEFWVR